MRDFRREAGVDAAYLHTGASTNTPIISWEPLTIRGECSNPEEEKSPNILMTAETRRTPCVDRRRLSTSEEGTRAANSEQIHCRG